MHYTQKCVIFINEYIKVFSSLLSNVLQVQAIPND